MHLLLLCGGFLLQERFGPEAVRQARRQEVRYWAFARREMFGQTIVGAQYLAFGVPGI